MSFLIFKKISDKVFSALKNTALFQLANQPRKNLLGRNNHANQGTAAASKKSRSATTARGRT
jgi:FtsZ-binding cell division protein ZapB